MEPNSQNIKTNYPDNLVSRLSRVYRKESSFTADDGKSVDYARLVLQGLDPDHDTVEIEVKLTKEQWSILKFMRPVINGSITEDGRVQ